MMMIVIFGDRKKQIRDKTKLQTATTSSFWFSGLLNSQSLLLFSVCLYVFVLPLQYTNNIYSVFINPPTHQVILKRRSQ